MSTLFGTKEEAKLTLRIMGVIVIVMAIVSIFGAIVSFASGEMYGQALTAIETTGGIELEAGSFAQGVSVSVLVLAIILGLLEAYVGYKGLREASGAEQGGGYLVLVKIYLALTVIGFIMILINALRTPGGFNDWTSLFTSVADILFIVFFLGSAKTLRDGRKK